ncbi:MAG TPA: lysine--tRNA ligase, partial [Candidatus Avimonas sp.]|nr:lysine--tRNA ligase [Candidatus Avimonas sp.]
MEQVNNPNVTENTLNEQELSEVLQMRRNKLFDLQNEGKDPFKITKWDRTHMAQEIVDRFDELEGQNVTIA